MIIVKIWKVTSLLQTICSRSLRSAGDESLNFLQQICLCFLSLFHTGWENIGAGQDTMHWGKRPEKARDAD